MASKLRMKNHLETIEGIISDEVKVCFECPVYYTCGRLPGNTFCRVIHLAIKEIEDNMRKQEMANEQQ